MKSRPRQPGLTLVETLVVVGIIAALVGLGLPAVRAMLRSFGSEESVRAMVQAGLSSARAMALEQQRYVGVRFQKASFGPGDGLNNPQYMIFIVHDTRATDLATGFRAVEGIQPIRLPDLLGVMDLTVVTRSADGSDVLREDLIRSDKGIDTVAEVNDTTTFSMVFSPTGHLVVHDVRILNREGRRGSEADPTKDSKSSSDDVFNTWAKITDKGDPRGMFLQDDYPRRGLGPESSRRSFVVYQTREFEQAFRTGTGEAYSRYLAGLQSKVLYVAPLTGAIVSRN